MGCLGYAELMVQVWVGCIPVVFSAGAHLQANLAWKWCAHGMTPVRHSREIGKCVRATSVLQCSYFRTRPSSPQRMLRQIYSSWKCALRAMST